MRDNIPQFINKKTIPVSSTKYNPFNQIIITNEKTQLNTQPQHRIEDIPNRQLKNQVMYCSTIQPSNTQKPTGKLEMMGRFVKVDSEKPQPKFENAYKNPIIPKHQKNTMFSSSIFTHDSTHQDMIRFPSFNVHAKPSILKTNEQIKPEVGNMIETPEQKRKRQIQAIRRQLDQVTKKLQNNTKQKNNIAQTNFSLDNTQKHSVTFHQIKIESNKNLNNQTKSTNFIPFQKDKQNQLSKIDFTSKNQNQVEAWGRKSGKLQKNTQIKRAFEEKDKFYQGKSIESPINKEINPKKNSSASYFDEFIVGQIEIKEQKSEKLKNQDKNSILLNHPKLDYTQNIKQQLSTPNVMNSSTSSTFSGSSLSTEINLSTLPNEKTFMKKKNPYIMQQKGLNEKKIMEIPKLSNKEELNPLINGKSNFSGRPSLDLKNGQQTRTFKKSDFEIGKKMGKGQFGQVMLVRHKSTGFLCGMKIMEKKQIRDQKYENQISRQLSIQFYLCHRNIAPLYGYFSDQQNVYLLVQFCTGGQLFERLKKDRRMNEQDLSPIIKQICQGTDYIHRQLIIHRDVKPQNILFSFGVVKICDFGWAVYRGQGLRKTASGSPLYYSPQIVLGNEYDQKIDIWDIGMMTYECLLGKVPFRIYSELDLKRIVTDEVKFPEYVDVSDEAKDFILKTLRKNAEQRMEIRQMLRHPFITKHKEKKLPQEIMEQLHRIVN